MTSGWIGVDLDGTLAHYDEWRGPLHIGAPIPEMCERVELWIADGRDVRIFTARVSDPHPGVVMEVREAIRAWCIAVLGCALPITNVKDYAMAELWDDRAVTVEANTGRPLAPSRRGLE